jgi:hypothetical protein
MPFNEKPQQAYRLAAMDLDDTLLGPDKTISRDNEAAAQRRQKPPQPWWRQRAIMKPAWRAPWPQSSNEPTRHLP